MPVTFDGPNKIMTEISVAGDNVLEVTDIYSEWKEWVLLGDNAKYEQAFSVVGGDPISDTQNLGSTFFLENGWRIRPAELTHKLTVVGNLFTREQGESPTIPVLGAFTVTTEFRVSNLTDASVARLDLDQLLQAVYIASFGVAGTDEGVGTPTNPVNNIDDALTIATSKGLRELIFATSFTITDQTIDGYELTGQDRSKTIITIDPAATVTNTGITQASVIGRLQGDSSLTECTLNGVTMEDGTIDRCIFNGTLTLTGTDQVNMLNCWSGVPGLSTPVVDFDGSGQRLGVRGYNGGIELRNKSGAGAVSIDMVSGQVILDSSVTNGTIVIRGLAKLTDNSVGADVNVTGLVFADEFQLSSFEGVVYLDGTSGISGTKFPIGTRSTPVDNLTDALSIMATRGLSEIVLKGSLTITSGQNISGLTFTGDNALSSVLILNSGCITEQTTLKKLIVTGVSNGALFCEKVGVNNLSNVGSNVAPLVFDECVFLEGTVTLRSGLGTPQNIQIADCTSGVAAVGTGFTLDFNGSTTPLAFRRFSGGITCENLTQNVRQTIEMNGRLVIEANCTDGEICTAGIIDITNNGTGSFVLDPSSTIEPADVDQVKTKTATLPIVIPAS